MFALLTPSATLAEAGDPLQYRQPDANGLLQAIKDQLRPEVDSLIRNAPADGPPQEVWYAVAPLLLDRQSPGRLGWLRGPPPILGAESDAAEGESTAWQHLAARVASGLADPGLLGRPPRDLLEVLASLAAGSPANADTPGALAHHGHVSH